MHAMRFDYHGAIERLGGDEELFRELVGFFLEDAPILLGELREALARQDAVAAERAAHSLKGLSGNFGAAGAVEAALAVEEAARAGELREAAEGLGRLEEEITSLETALESVA